ncbi:MAG: hypothetical protein AB7U59_13815 [Desulfovibrionaceae bacterium]
MTKKKSRKMTLAEGKRDCATCGWGVRWVRSDYDSKLYGRCLFKPSIPVPRHYGFPCGFAEETPMPENCPAWKEPKDVNYVPRWREEYLDYALRVEAYSAKKIEDALQKIKELDAKIIAEDPEMASRLGLTNRETL